LLKNDHLLYRHLEIKMIKLILLTSHFNYLQLLHHLYQRIHQPYKAGKVDARITLLKKCLIFYVKQLKYEVMIYNRLY